MAVGAATAVFVGATLFGALEAKKREKRTNQANERASQVEQAIATHQARQATRRQIREARVKQAAVENVAASAGQGEGSAAISAQGSLQTALATNIGSINEAQAQAGVKHKSQMDIYKASEKSDFERLSNVTASVSGRFAG